NISPASAGAYSVSVSNSLGVVVGPEFTVQVAPARIIAGPINEIGLLASDVTFLVNAIGPPLLSYQWQFEGADLPGQTNSSLHLTNLQLSQAGEYSVTVS